MTRIPTSVIIPVLLAAFLIYLWRYYWSQSDSVTATSNPFQQPTFVGAMVSILSAVVYLIVDGVAPNPIYSEIVFGLALLLAVGAAVIIYRRLTQDPT
jgi:hypothetical protein